MKAKRDSARTVFSSSARTGDSRIRTIAAAALLLCCAFTVCRSPLESPDEQFDLDLSLRWSEVSKDTHSDWHKVSIKGRNVSYQWTHNGFPGHMEDYKKY